MPRLLACALICCGLLVADAKSQFTSIDAETAQSVTLSATQRAEITAFIDSLKEDVFSEKPGTARRALDFLLAPLQSEGVSVAFRQVMAEALLDEINRAVRDDRQMIVGANGESTINPRPYTALRLAGEIATDRTLDAVRSQLESEFEGRRFFAIHCTEIVFFAVQVSAPAVTKQALYRESGGKAGGVIAELGELLVKEKSSRHATAIVRSLGEAGEISTGQLQGVARHAIRLIGDKTSDRIRAGQDTTPTFEERKVWITAGQAVFPVIAQPAGDIDQETARAAIRLAGHLVATVYRDIEAQRVDDQNDELLPVIQKQTLELAQNLLTFGERRYADAMNRQIDPRIEQAAGDLVDAFSGHGNFRQAALALISTNGLLTDAPFGFDDEEFIGR